MATLHSMKDPIRTRLNRQMDLFAQTRQFCERRCQIIGDVARVRARKSNPHLTVHEVIDLSEQFHEADRRRQFPPVGVDRLTQERDLAVSLPLEPTDLLHDLIRGPAALTTPSERDHAKGTEAIAPLHDADPGPDAVSALNRRVYRIGVAGRSRRRKAPRSPSLKQRRNGSELSRADHKVQIRKSLEKRLPFLLSDTPTDANLQSFSLPFQHLIGPEAAVDLMLCLLTNSAGIEKNQVGLFLMLGERIPLAEKQSSNPLRVKFIGLTAKGDQL